MKRLLLLVTLALMLAAAMALSRVAQAASPSSKCQQAAASLGISGSYKYIAGSDKKNDNFTSKGTEGADVFCGFGGNDSIETLREGDIFIGGAGNDKVSETNYGTFYGEEGNDFASENYGTFVQ